MKTTNAKAVAFQTPGGLKGQTIKTQKQTRSPRLNRGKVKIHTSPTLQVDQESDNEIETNPGRGVPLEDNPPDWSPKDYSCLKPENITKGWAAASGTRARREKILKDQEDWEENGRKEWEAEQEAAIARSIGLDDPLETARPVKKSTTAAPSREKKAVKPKESNPSTMTSRAFASALSTQPPTIRQPTRPTQTARSNRAGGFAAPTKSALARKGQAANKENADLDIQRVKDLKAKSAHAQLASKQTLGYGKGRSVSGQLRTDSITSEKPAAEEKKEIKRESLTELFRDLDEEEDSTDTRPLSPFELGAHDDDDDFQFELPSGI
jgi:hypothetical protein